MGGAGCQRRGLLVITHKSWTASSRCCGLWLLSVRMPLSVVLPKDVGNHHRGLGTRLQIMLVGEEPGPGRHAGGQARRRAGTQAGRHAGGQARRRAGTQAGRHTGGQAHRRAGTQAGRHTGGQAHRRAGTQACPYRRMRLIVGAILRDRPFRHAMYQHNLKPHHAGEKPARLTPALGRCIIT
jgi:hypothetical protein